MRTNLKQLITLLLFFVFFSGLTAQNNYWTLIKEGDVREKEKLDRNTTPENYQLYRLNLEAFKQELENAPVRGKIQGKSSHVILFPTPEGEMQQYRVTESPIMPEGLSSRYANIKTYSAVGIDDPTATMRFSITQFGLHNMLMSGRDGQSFIDPYTTDLEDYIVYYKRNLPADKREFNCYTEEGHIEAPEANFDGKPKALSTDDSTLRTYRLALSAHKDYGDVFAADSEEGEEKADIMAQMVIAINRVNEIYERDLGITLEFVENNDDLIFHSGISENPWQGSDGVWDYMMGTFNDKTQEVHDEIIGDENYDVGHNFNTSEGGNAGCLTCVCSSGEKGSAYTGLPNPLGDAFYVDFVAHEFGHQFGGWHVMNTCSRSGSGQTEVEPASGSTIMGYAGYCEINIQYQSDSHFNYVNIRDISANIQDGSSSACPELIEIENQLPTADAGEDYTIPKSTAFVLVGEGSDPDGEEETLTYEWAQNDPEQAYTNGPLNSELTSGAIYRSYTPKETPERYFPEINQVLAGNLTPAWEMTPAVGRELNFSFVVRDNGSGFADAIGQTASDVMKITVDGDAGPFEVTSQNDSDLEVEFNATEEITWEVANTDNQDINAQEVDIFLSVDGGDFDIVLAEGVPNNGSAEITIPEIETTNARIMVKASDNVFFAVNQKKFTITDELSVEKNELDKLTFYPNPSDGNFTVSFNPVYGDEVNIEVYSLEGKLVFNQNFEGGANFEKEINLKSANAGLYILRVKNGSHTVNKKLIIH